MKPLTFLVAVLLTGCATQKSYLEAQPVASAEEKALAQNELIRCVEAYAKKLDDGISPANLIAQSVASACRDPYAIVYRTQTSGMPSAFVSGFEGSDWTQTKVRQTKTMVLAIRARERNKPVSTARSLN